MGVCQDFKNIPPRAGSSGSYRPGGSELLWYRPDQRLRPSVCSRTVVGSTPIREGLIPSILSLPASLSKLTTYMPSFG